MSKELKKETKKHSEEAEALPDLPSVEVAEKTEKPVEKPKAPSDIVTVKVRTGSMICELGNFQKDSTFQCKRDRALLFGSDVEILEA